MEVDESGHSSSASEVSEDWSSRRRSTRNTRAKALTQGKQIKVSPDQRKLQKPGPSHAKDNPPDEEMESESEPESVPEDQESANVTAISAVLYLLILQPKLAPVSLTEIAKNACEMGRAYVAQHVMVKVKQRLDETFGVKLVEINTSKREAKKNYANTSYIVVSSFPIETIKVDLDFLKLDAHIPKSFLYSVLGIMFLKRTPIGEEQLYEFYKGMLGESRLCKNEEDFRRFMKREYVQSHYLSIVKDEADPLVLSYEWGPRSEAEFSKFHLLQNIAKYYPIKLSEWPVQVEQIENELNCKIVIKGGKLMLRDECESSDVNSDASGQEAESDDQMERGSESEE